MIFGILLGIVLFVVISVALLAFYVAFKRYCSDSKTSYGVVNHDSKVKHGRLYPALYKDSDEDAGGSGSTAPCIDEVDLPQDRPKVGEHDEGLGHDKHEEHKDDLNCTLVECEKEPDYVVPSSLAKPYVRDGGEHVPPANSSAWNHVQPGSSREGTSHYNEGFHSGVGPHNGYTDDIHPVDDGEV
ncbi:uncharacterized protein LOC135400574 [Ornithodoros turicata]|uniref:Uncharacterized protein n=1 Tax=Ornithodoros turicata TaxID=34597 RepID=A0A2R5L6Y7_9ACAR